MSSSSRSLRRHATALPDSLPRSDRRTDARPSGAAGALGGIHDLVECALDVGLVGLADLVEDVPDLVRPAALHGDAGQDDRQGSQQAAATIDADHVEPLAGEAAAVKIGEELLPFGGAFAPRQAEVDDLLLAIRAQPQSNENRPTQRAGAGLAGKHHAIEHQHLVAVLQRPAMEGGHRGIERLGDLAHRLGAHRSAKDRQQRLAYLAGRQPSTKPAGSPGRSPACAAHRRRMTSTGL